MTHTLGKHGPPLPALGLGLMGMSHSLYGSIGGDEERFKVLDRALELGATFWDSSDLYGDSEELVGKWFKRTGKRNEIFLATKFGYVKGAKDFNTVDSSAEYCKKACAESLRILGVDYIDLYYLHTPNPDTPIEETMRALVELKAEGKIKYIGLSAISADTLRRAHKIAHVDAVQTDYSVFMRDVEGPAGTNLLAACHELGSALVAACPLGRGMITTGFANGEVSNDMKDFRSQVMPRFQEGNRDHNAKIISQFKVLADKKGCTVPQLALRWLLKQGHDIFPIPGTKKIKYLEENWASLKIPFSDDDEAAIRTFVQAAKPAGDVVPAQYAGHIFKDTKEESA